MLLLHVMPGCNSFLFEVGKTKLHNKKVFEKMMSDAGEEIIIQLYSDAKKVLFI